MWKYNRRDSQSSCSGETYYFSRNIPHPKLVRHMPGLNNTLICVVRSSFSRENRSAHHTLIPEREAELTRNVKRSTPASCHLTKKLESFAQREISTSQSVTQGHADGPERIQNNPASSEKRLASGDQQKSQPALHKDSPHDCKKGYTTTTSSVSVHEPQLNHNMWKYNRRDSQSSCSGETYYFSRNIPHPKLVRHMPGLNNTLICVVRSSFSRENRSAHHTLIPEREAELPRNAKSSTPASCHLTKKLEGFAQREISTSQSVTQGHADGPERIQNNPASSEKVLEKLHKILQTDSLTEIQKWLATASKKEKDFVFDLIYSELTDEGMLNSKEDTAENMNSPSLLKPVPPLRRGSERELNQARSSAKESVASQNMEQEREKECLLLPPLRNRDPAQADTLFPGKNCN